MTTPRTALDYGTIVELIKTEQTIVERKYNVLATRRNEEQEARAAYIRKIARVKAVEDAQAKDPSNFRNQKRF